MVCQSLRMVKFGFAYLLQHGWAWMSYWEIKTICSRLYIYTYLCVSILASICFFQKITPISYKILQMRLLFTNPCRDAIVTSYVDAHWLKKGRGRPLLDEGYSLSSTPSEPPLRPSYWLFRMATTSLHISCINIIGCAVWLEKTHLHLCFHKIQRVIELTNSNTTCDLALIGVEWILLIVEKETSCAFITKVILLS